MGAGINSTDSCGLALGGVGIVAYSVDEGNTRNDLCDAFVTGYTPPGFPSLEAQLVEHRKSGFIREGTLDLDGSMTDHGEARLLPRVRHRC